MTTRRRALLVLTVALLLPLAAACGGGGDSPAVSEEEKPAAPTRASVEPSPEAVLEEEPEEEVSADGGFSPLGLLTGEIPGLGGDLSGLDFGGDVDPELGALLLHEEDLPQGFGSFGSGEFGFDLPSDEGAMTMAMSMFLAGDVASATEVPSAIISMAMALPPEVLEEALAEFPTGPGAEEQVEAALREADAGVAFQELEILETSGLGEEAFGVHLVMEISAFAGAQGDPGGGAMAFDLYAFTRGGHVLMLMVMWPADQPRPVDAVALAVIMDEKALEAS